MRKQLAATFLLLVVLLPASVSADTARDTFEQFKKLEAQLSVGIAYNDFIKGLGEVSYLVDRFRRETETIFAVRANAGQQLTREEKRLLELRIGFSSIKADLGLTQIMWEITLNGRHHDPITSNFYWKDFLEKHPDANKDKKSGGVIGTIGKKKVIYFKPVMQIYWADVSVKLKELEEYFQQPPTSDTQAESPRGEKP